MQFDISSFVTGTLLALLITAFINHRLAVARSKEERKIKLFNEAAQSFRDAFILELTSAQSANRSGPEIYYILEKALPRREAAVIAFQTTFAVRRNPPLRESMDRLLLPRRKPRRGPCPFCDYVSECNETVEIGCRQVASQKIESILSFAKFK